jgi:hypothetical protein
MYPGGMPMHPAFIGAAYNSIQAMNLLPAYNQHLAGMQQLAQICVGNGPYVLPYACLVSVRCYQQMVIFELNFSSLAAHLIIIVHALRCLLRLVAGDHQKG